MPKLQRASFEEILEYIISAPRLVMTLSIAVQALRATPLRTALTLIGVIIGVASVVVIVALGQGASQDLKRNIESLGVNTLIISPAPRGPSFDNKPPRPLSDRDVEQLREQLPNVTRIAPQIRRTALVSGQKGSVRTTIFGVTSAFFDLTQAKTEHGRLLNETEIRSNATHAVIGTNIAKKVFGDSNPVGQTFRINQTPFSVVGVLTAEGRTLFGEPDDMVLIPLNSSRQRLGARKAGFANIIDSLQIQFSDADSLSRGEVMTKDILRKRDNLQDNDDIAFSVLSTAQLAEQSQGFVRGLQLILSAIAAISLFVGSVGLANILIVSVNERTKEIGLRMAIGARQSDIRAQFLAESLVLSLAGGIFGTIFGGVIVLTLSELFGWTSIIDVGIMLVAFILSILVGVLAGTYPAKRAADLSPMAALRDL